MRTDARRAKKLTVAFHFHRSDQARWKCDTCRAKGLERSRRCGWTDAAAKTPERAVWARGNVSTTVCPKSWITAESLALIEEYCVWKMSGNADFRTLSARQADAFSTLEIELAKGE